MVESAAQIHLPDLGICTYYHHPSPPSQGWGNQENENGARDKLPELLSVLGLWLSLCLCTDYTQHKRSSLELLSHDANHRYPFTQ